MQKGEGASGLFPEQHVTARDILFYIYFPFGKVFSTSGFPTQIPPILVLVNTNGNQHGCLCLDLHCRFAGTHSKLAFVIVEAFNDAGVAIAGVRMLMWLSLLFVDQAWLTDNDYSIASMLC